MRTSLGRCQGDRIPPTHPTLCHQQTILGGVPFNCLHLITRGSEWPRASRWHSIRVSHLAVFVLPPWLRRCSRCHLIIIPCRIPIKRWVCLLSLPPLATAPHLCYSSAWQEAGLNLSWRFWSRKSSPLLLHCNMRASGSVWLKSESFCAQTNIRNNSNTWDVGFSYNFSL